MMRTGEKFEAGTQVWVGKDRKMKRLIVPGLLAFVGLAAGVQALMLQAGSSQDTPPQKATAAPAQARPETTRPTGIVISPRIGRTRRPHRLDI